MRKVLRYCYSESWDTTLKTMNHQFTCCPQLGFFVITCWNLPTVLALHQLPVKGNLFNNHCHFLVITKCSRYTECTKHYENLPNIDLHPFLPSEQPHFKGAWTLQGVESVPQGCWPVLTPMLPIVLSSWLDVLWVVDHSWYTRETVEC